MKYYIASSLENAEQVQRLARVLNSWGWTQTHDWAQHGSVQAQGREKIRDTAERELDGVREADIVIIMLPGGRGTHVELGTALALNKRIILYAESQEKLEQTNRICSFYTLTDIVIGDTFDLLDRLYPMR